MDMFTSSGHIKKQKYNYRFFDDFSLIVLLLNDNFHPLEVVSRYRDPQLQVGDNLNQIT